MSQTNLNQPRDFSEYIGQTNIINNLKVFLESAKIRKTSLDHILLYGNSGHGKTTLAHLIAQHMNQEMIKLNGPSLQKPSDIISPLTALKENEFLFIDEVHAVTKEVLEVIYPVLESNELSVILGKDYNSKVINIKLKPFTFICATTEINKLPLPFLNRFSIHLNLEPYKKSDITKIVSNYSSRIKFEIPKELCNFISEFTKNNPRVAINIVKRIYDYFLILKPEELNKKFLISTLNKMDIYKYGLNRTDVRYLEILNKNGILGLDSISQIIDLPQTIIMSTIEPILIRNGLIGKTFRGRKITDKGVKFLSEKQEY